MTDITKFYLGKSPVKHDARTLKLAKYLSNTLPPAPASVDWSKGITNWSMMKNDELGDCTIAGCGHALQIWSLNTGKEITLSDNQIVQMYESWDGYDPQNPNSNNGGIELDVLTSWRNQGLFGHKIIGFAALNHINFNEVKQAINLFGGVYIGLDLPISAQNQDVWDFSVTDTSGEYTAGSWGGHCVFVVGYDAHGITCITWGQCKKMTWAFWAAYCDEAYAIFAQDWINTGGLSPNGVDVAQLEQDLSQIQ